MTYPEQLKMQETEESQPASERERCPLSFAQERLWFLDQLQPGSSAYNVAQAWRLRGEFNQLAFTRAVNEVTRRHESLRTTYSRIEGKPVEIISCSSPFELRVINLSDDSKLHSVLQQSASRPFDLQRGPLFRVDVFRLNPNEHVVLFGIHHIVADAWSFEVLRREITLLYAAESAGRSIQLPELPIQYLDYAHWQRERVAGETLREQVEFWKQYLSGELPRLELPGALCHECVSDRASSEEFCLSPDVTARLRIVAQNEDATLFTVLFAAFNALLHRVTGQSDFIVGTPISCRDLSETENLIGLLVNVVPLRTRIGDNPRFSDLLRHVRASAFEAFAHHEVPFEDILKTVHAGRHDGTNPLLQTVVALHGGYPAAWQLGNLEASTIDVTVPTAKFDLTLLLEEAGNGIKGRLEYKTDLFEANLMRRLLQQLELLLSGIARNPGQRISEYPLCTESERTLLTIEWNNTARDYERDSCIHQVFEAQARSTPDAAAVEFGTARLTYFELNQRANRLARRLKHLGVQPGTLVGLALERSIELIVAMLAILKAGGAYVPLDRGYPAGRIAGMIRDAQLRLILSDVEFEQWVRRNQLNDDFDALPVRFIRAGDESGLGNESAEDLTTTTTAASAAYVMFTSGSTGTPKGVVIPHRGVVRLVRGANYAVFSPDHVFLQLAPVSFDASTFEIWGALLNGARLVVFPPHPPTLEELGRCIAGNKISTLWLTAGLFHQMIDEQLSALKSLRQLLAGGDVLSVPHVLKATRELPDCQIINGYGPTENTTFTCCWPVPRDWAGGRSVPIGMPVSNTRVHVLDEHFQPVPMGVPGELFVAGDGLACGYLNAPELTRETFVTVPTAHAASGERLYRTGDRVRWLADGALEFMGRKDQQLKIRGFRVEPGEIESALARHPDVRQAVVIGRECGSGIRELVAYIAPAANATFNDEQLRKHLEPLLPSYMVPSRFVSLEALPLTPNGKIDVRALPAPSESIPGSVAAVPPRDDTEQRLHQIWQEVLGRNSFGIHDNFFLLGGHSLLVVRMISRITRAFSIELPVRTVFEAPTVASLAAKLRSVEPSTSPAGNIAPRITARSKAQQLLTRINELSDAEVESLLLRPK